jgi:hypothetical protein
MIFSPYTLSGRKLNFGGHPMRAVIALTGCAVVTMLAGCDRLSVDKEIDTTTTATDPGYSVTGAELIETDASGLPRYRLTADRIVQDPVSLQISIERPRLGLNEAGDPAPVGVAYAVRLLVTQFAVHLADAAPPVTVIPDTDCGDALKLYPNPVGEKLRVVVGVSFSGPYTAEVFNAAGVEVWKKSGISAGTKTVEVGTSALRSGVYALVLTDAKGDTRVEKFVRE